MKHIGHIDGANAMPSTWKTHSLGMLSPHELFIPNPGERENVSTDQWHHVGWVDPDKDGGCVWDTHAEAGANSRPAYIQLEAGETPQAPTEPQASVKSTIPTDQLIQEALEFCTELDDFDGPEYSSESEICCQRANVYILELVRRLQSPAADRAPPAFWVRKNSSGQNTFWEAPVPDGVPLYYDVVPPAPPLDSLTGQQHDDLMRLASPMTFYDHAFLSAWWSLSASGYSDEVRATRAHELASVTIRYRQPKP